MQQTSQSGGPSPQYQFDGHNHIVGLSYDAAGNLLNDGISHSFVYDAEGKVLAVDGGSTAQYVYDALGQRVGVQTASTAVEYLYDAFGRQSSSWLVANNLGNAGRVYSDTAQIAYRSPSGLTYFEHQDWEGTERLRTNYLGNAAATESSLAYGDNYVQTVTIPGGDKDANQFTSHDWDAESGTDHFLFRQYMPTQGRWMSPDPYDGSYDLTNPQSLNRYTYAVSNPYTYLDPLGSTILCTTTTYYVDGQVDSVETNCIDDGSIGGGGGNLPYPGGGAGDGPGGGGGASGPNPNNPTLPPCNPATTHCGNPNPNQQACLTNCHRPTGTPGPSRPALTPCQSAAVLGTTAGLTFGPWASLEAAWFGYVISGGAGIYGLVKCFRKSMPRLLSGKKLLTASPFRSGHFLIASGIALAAMSLGGVIAFRYEKKLSFSAHLFLFSMIDMQIAYQWLRAWLYLKQIRKQVWESSRRGNDAFDRHERLALETAAGGICDLLFYSCGMAFMALVIVAVLLSRR